MHSSANWLHNWFLRTSTLWRNSLSFPDAGSHFENTVGAWWSTKPLYRSYILSPSRLICTNGYMCTSNTITAFFLVLHCVFEIKYILSIGPDQQGMWLHDVLGENEGFWCRHKKSVSWRRVGFTLQYVYCIRYLQIVCRPMKCKCTLFLLAHICGICNYICTRCHQEVAEDLLGPVHRGVQVILRTHSTACNVTSSGYFLKNLINIIDDWYLLVSTFKVPYHSWASSHHVLYPLVLHVFGYGCCKGNGSALMGSSLPPPFHFPCQWERHERRTGQIIMTSYSLSGNEMVLEPRLSKKKKSHSLTHLFICKNIGPPTPSPHWKNGFRESINQSMKGSEWRETPLQSVKWRWASTCVP